MEKKTFRSFKSARKFAQKLGLKNRPEWVKYCKSGNKPDDIPADPNGTYKNEFKGVRDWLGTERSSYTEAREFVQKFAFNSISKWLAYCKSGNKPDHIPSSPDKVYKKEWVSWPEFLGNRNIASQKKKFVSFKDARNFVRKLKLKNTSAWNEYRKSEDKSDNIPSTPNMVYKKEWKGMPDWLGNGNLSNTRRPPRLTYDECSLFAQKNNILTRKQWGNFSKSSKRPENVPGSPWNFYKKQGTWISWIDFAGGGRIANQNREFKSFQDAREFVRSLKLKGTTEWKEYCKSHKQPDDIHSAPQILYKKEWKGWGDFLGTGTISNKNKSKYYLTWPEAQKEYQRLAKEYGFRNGNDWRKFAKKNSKLLEKLRIPKEPTIYTRERVWRTEYEN
jgi:hypothetical protein